MMAKYSVFKQDTRKAGEFKITVPETKAPSGYRS